MPLNRNRSLVTKWGLDFYPLAGDPKQLLKLFVENPNMFSMSFARECVNYLEFIGHLITTCWEAITTGSGTDAIIQNPAAFGAPHAAEKLGVCQACNRSN
jgi:sterol 3beta-glucosyltransferase